MSVIYAMVFVFLGLVSVALFYAGIYFPIWGSVLILVFVSLHLVRQYLKQRLGLLMLLLWLVYALPFIHILPYIWFDFGTQPLLLWGLVVNPYMVDERVIQLTAMIGAVGGLGFALGVSASEKKIEKDYGKNQNGSKRLFRTIAWPLWILWVVIGVLLTALSAPQETIFTANYTDSVSLLDGANFSSAWMLSYVILSFAFCDALLEKAPEIKRFKMAIIVASIFWVVVYYQLLRGDRECIPWVFGLALVYYYWAAGVTQPRGFQIPWHKLVGTAFALLVVTMGVGVLRSSLVGVQASEATDRISEIYQSGAIGIDKLFVGTWSAVLLTPLSVAGDHIYGFLTVKWGQDYINLLLSAIPGFLADAIDYARPIDSNSSPAWEMRYGIGGTHATVVPFINFGMLGVFLIPALWAWFLYRFERSTLRQITVIGLSFLVTFAMTAPHWLWYGEKSGMNALIIWAILSFLYRITLGLSRMTNNELLHR